jgi:hypothetical protein
MHGSTSGRSHEVDVVCRLADAVFHALRTEFDVDPSVSLELRRSDALSAGPDAEQAHLAVMSLLCAQLLHRLGNPRTAGDVDDVFVLISALDVLLGRLLAEARRDSPSARRLREVRREFVEAGLELSGPLLRADDGRPKRS